MKVIDELAKQADIIRNKSEYYRVGEDQIEIKPITVGNIIAISPHLNKIVMTEDIESPQQFYDKLIEDVDKYMGPIRSIFEELIDYDLDKLLPIDIVNILLLIISQIDTKSFQNSIILMKKISRNSREIIAQANKDEQSCSIQ